MSIWDDTPLLPSAFQQQRLLPPTYQPIAADQYQYEQQMQGMEPQFAEPTQQLQMPGMGSLAGTTLKAGPMAGMAGPIAGGVMGAALLGKGLYDTYNNKQGDPFSRAQAGFSTMGASEAYRLGSKMFAGKTNRDQLQRDAVRNDLRSTGFIDNSYNVSLADGRKFDIGKDGSSKAYNVDFTKDGAKDAVGATQGLAAILAGSGKAKDDLAGYLANAAMSSGKYNADDSRALYAKAGIDKQKAFDATNEMANSGQIDHATKAAYQNSFNSLFVSPPKKRR